MEDISLEEAFSKLEDIIKNLEDKNISLEDSFKMYKEGIDTLKYCNDKIDAVEKKIQLISDNGELNEF